MSIHTVCPSCNCPFVLGEELGGQAFVCTACETEFQLPEPAPIPLPPLEMTSQYQRIVRPRRPVILVLLGAGNVDEEMERGLGHALWNLRHLFVLFGIVAATVIFTNSQNSARRAGPSFFGATVICFLLGYLIAISIAQREIGDSSKRLSLLSRLLLLPLVLIFGDARSAMPALRTFFIGGCLIVATLLVGMRAGSLASVIPHPSFDMRTPERASAHSTVGPTTPKVVIFGAKASPESNKGSIKLVLEPAPSATQPSPTPENPAPPPPPGSPGTAYTSPPPPPAE